MSVSSALLRVFAFLLSLLAFVFLIVVPAVWAVHKMGWPQEWTSSAEGLLLLFTLMLDVYFFRKYIDNLSVLSLGFLWRPKSFLLGMSLGAVVNFLGFGLLFLSGNITIQSAHLSSGLYWELFRFAEVALFEEILVRAYILATLLRAMDKYHALAVSALVFALLHILNPGLSFLAFLNIFLAGILLGVNYLYQGNLWFSIGVHFAWNVVQGPLLGFQVSGNTTDACLALQTSGPDLLTGGAFGFEGSILATIIIALSIWLVYLFSVNHSRVLE